MQRTVEQLERSASSEEVTSSSLDGSVAAVPADAHANKPKATKPAATNETDDRIVMCSALKKTNMPLPRSALLGLAH